MFTSGAYTLQENTTIDGHILIAGELVVNEKDGGGVFNDGCGVTHTVFLDPSMPLPILSPSFMSSGSWVT